MVYVLAGTFASDTFIEKGDFRDVSGRTFSYLDPETGKAEYCDRRKVQFDINSVDISDIYLHDNLQGDVNIYQEEIETEEIPSHAFKEGELYYAFI